MSCGLKLLCMVEHDSALIQELLLLLGLFPGLPRYSEAMEDSRMCHHEPNTRLHALWIVSRRGSILHKKPPLI